MKSFVFKEIDSLSQKYNPYVKNTHIYTIQYVVNFAYILIGAIFPETNLRQKINILILLYISQNRILYSQGQFSYYIIISMTYTSSKNQNGNAKNAKNE